MNRIVLKNFARHFVKEFRPLNVYSEDIFVVSFPRSGNTWMSFFLANLRKRDFGINEVDYDNVIYLCPDIHTSQFHHKAVKPRYLKSHFGCLPRYPKIIYLLRDPRDVSLSFFGMLVKRGYENRWNDFTEFWSDFLKGCVPYGKWSDHILSFEQFTGPKLLIQYESLLKGPVQTVRPMLNFLGISKTDDEIREALELSSPKTLQMLAKRVDFIKDWEVFNEKKLRRIEKKKAISGKWRGILTTEQNDQIFEMWGTMMARYGYQYWP